MFTGIVETIGTIKKIDNNDNKVYLTVGVKNFLADVKTGDSIACDGCCLTVVKKTKDEFTVELMPETLRLTNFSSALPGAAINLEKAMRLGGKLDGHFVTGHIDAVGTVKKIIQDGDYVCLEIKVPQKIAKYLAHKGSVAVNGVSLTIADSAKDLVKVCLISHTLAVTNLGRLKPSDKINLEVDIIARYLAKLISE